MTVAVVDAYDLPTAEADLAAYRTQYGLPPCTTANGCFRKVNQNGLTSPLPAADAGWGAEIALDIDMVSAACPNCNILLVEANNNSTANLAESVDTAVALGAMAVSNSYGTYESSGQTFYDSHYNHPGVAITVSTGDCGYDCSGNYIGASWPAVSPNVVAVGGTKLTRNASTRGWTESAWGVPGSGQGAGSGCSVYESKPSWQHDSGCATRTIGDVSAVADPATGVAVYVDGAWDVYGGTSASSPIIAAVYALAGAPGAGTYPASFLYADAADLFDVTSGTNDIWAVPDCTVFYLCNGVVGYDGPTGLGTPNGVHAFAVAVPANDDLANATTISGNTASIDGANVGATTEPGEPATCSVNCGTSGPNATVWYSWTAPNDGPATFDTCSNADLDSMLSVYTGSAYPLAKVTEDDDSCSPQSHVSFAVAAGTTYLVQVDGYGGDMDTFTLTWSLPAPPAVSINDVSVNENAGSASFTVSLSAASAQSVTVNYATADNTGSAPGDYTAASGPLTFNPGETSMTVNVPITNDALNEPTETFFVNLTSPANATIADGQGTGTIVDDDVATRRPDGRIRKGRGAYVGNNIYNTTGLNQSKIGAKARGYTIKFGVSVQNDGLVADRLKLSVSGTVSTMYRVTYWHGTTNITAAVVAGTFTTPSLAPGTTYLVTAKVKVKWSATKGSSTSRLVTITSAGDGTGQDAVSFTGKRL